jgi:hypothetical protein
MAATDKKEATFVEMVEAEAKKWGLRIIKAIVLIIIVMIGISWVGRRNAAYKKAHPQSITAAESREKYIEKYNFSKITGRADAQTFTIPAGNGWVLVMLPAGYRTVFSSATANAGELDKLDGSKPTPFGEQTDFGKASKKNPMSVAIRVPEGCEMTASFVKHSAAPNKEVKRSNSRFVKKAVHRTVEDKPTFVQIEG